MSLTVQPPPHSKPQTLRLKQASLTGCLILFPVAHGQAESNSNESSDGQAREACVAFWTLMRILSVEQTLPVSETCS